MPASNEPNFTFDPSPQLLWANCLAICASLLLALFLLTLAVGWARHFSPWLRLSALLSMLAGAAVTLAAHHLYDTYAFWWALLDQLFFHQHSPPEPTMLVYYHEQVSANQQAVVLGWGGSVVTGALLAVGLLGMWRLLRQTPVVDG